MKAFNLIPDNPSTWIAAMWRAGWSAAFIRYRLELAGFALIDGALVRVWGGAA